MLSTHNRTEMHEKRGSILFVEYIQDLQEDVVSWLEIFGQFVSKKECVVCSVNIFVHKCVHFNIDKVQNKVKITFLTVCQGCRAQISVMLLTDES